MSKIKRGGQVESAARWDIPPMDAAATPKKPVNYNETLAAVSKNIPSQKDIEDIKQQAYEEAYAQGLQEGRTNGHDEFASLIQVARSILEQLSEPTELIDLKVKEQLVALTMAIAKQLVKSEIKESSERVYKLVEQAVNILPESSDEIHIHVSPKDIEAITEKIGSDAKTNNWSFVQDDSIMAGGCKVFTESSSVDLTIDAQLARIAARFFDIDEDDGTTVAEIVV